MEPGNVLKHPCPSCGGQLVAKRRMKNTTEPSTKPAQELWDVICARCGYRFHYEPGADRIMRYQP